MLVPSEAEPAAPEAVVNEEAAEEPLALQVVVVKVVARAVVVVLAAAVLAATVVVVVLVGSGRQKLTEKSGLAIICAVSPCDPSARSTTSVTSTPERLAARPLDSGINPRVHARRSSSSCKVPELTRFAEAWPSEALATS
mmetsp:Transcript_146264/g.407445  ORF Transcript_146264/g.407445 Transcript_146264/m.407445 type:complete len:140 (+) Transcript_146264:989-1408(+)